MSAVVDSILSIIDMEKAAAFGEPEYAFYRRRLNYHGGHGRREGCHVGGNWVEVTEEEFNKNYESARELDMKRFMNGTGKDGVRRSFDVYERKVKTPGWPQLLMAALKKQYPESIL